MAWNNIGLAHKGLDELEPARHAFTRAISLDPALDLAHSNLANVLYRLGRYADARTAYQTALRINPGNGLTRWNLGLCRLVLGEWPEGWRDYESRWSQGHLPIFAAREFFSRARWSGAENPSGRTIFLHAEQGLGDTLQFCRYALLLHQRGARVIVEVPPALQALIGRNFAPDIRVIARGQAIPSFDCHCPLLSLPLAFGTTRASVPAAGAYIRASAERTSLWEQRLGLRARPRVGLVWRSGISDPQRDLPLELLRALDDGRWDLIGLQTELRATERGVLSSFSHLLWLGDEIRDFEDTTALASLCDLVITVDTCTAHLAGALGRPTWIVLPFAPDWRWLLERSDTPWYPSARLFRQRAPANWDGIGEELARAGAHLL